MKIYTRYINNYNYLKVDENDIIYNTKTNRVVKLKVNNYSVGIWIGKKFLVNPEKHFKPIEVEIPKNDFERQLLSYNSK